MRAKHMGRGHEDNRYGGKPPMTMGKGHEGHPIHHKRARGGSVGDEEKMPKEEVYEGAGSRTEAEAKKRARGGKAPMHVAGAASRHHRLDRRGRKSGGSVGADSHPLTEASRLSAAGKGQSAEDD